MGDQKLPPLPYATSVPVETGTKLVGTKRGCGNKRCKMLIIGFVIGAVVVVAVAVGIFMATRYTRRSHVSTTVVCFVLFVPFLFLFLTGWLVA